MLLLHFHEFFYSESSAVRQIDQECLGHLNVQVCTTEGVISINYKIFTFFSVGFYKV